MKQSIKIPESKYFAVMEDRNKEMEKWEKKLPLLLIECAALIMRGERFQVILERLIQDLQTYYDLKYTRVEVE